MIAGIYGTWNVLEGSTISLNPHKHFLRPTLVLQTRTLRPRDDVFGFAHESVGWCGKTGVQWVLV